MKIGALFASAAMATAVGKAQSTSRNPKQDKFHLRIHVHRHLIGSIFHGHLQSKHLKPSH